MDCILCKIVDKQELATYIYEDDDIIGIENKYPTAPIHLLFIIKNHIEWKDDIKDNIFNKLVITAKNTAKDKGLDTYKLIFNIGKTAHFPHIHLHLMGGWKEAEIPKD